MADLKETKYIPSASKSCFDAKQMKWFGLEIH